MASSIFGSIHVELYRFNLDDNALRKGWHMPLKMAGLVTSRLLTEIG
jgi:hypothetical protein